jgi:hypothetical protein
VDGQTPICERFDEHLPELIGLDGEEPAVSRDEREALLRHVEACGRCADARRAYLATVELLRALPTKKAPDDFLSWVGADLPGASPHRPGSRRRWLALAAALPVLAAAGLFLASLMDRGGPIPEVAMAPAPPRAPPESLSGSAQADAPLPPAVEFRNRDEPGKATAASADALSVEAPSPPPPEETVLLALPYVPGRWDADLASLEREVRGRFAAPSRSDGDARGPSFGSPRAPAPAAAPPVEADTRAAGDVLRDRADLERVEQAASATAAPASREITVLVEPARLPELRRFMDSWSPASMQASRRGARRAVLPAEERLQEKTEGAPRPPVRVRIRIEPRTASPDPRSP